MVKRRSPAWSYLGALFVVIAGWSAAVIIAAGDWDPVKDADITSVSEPTDKSAQSGRIAVYTDTLQADRKIACTGKQQPDESKKTKGSDKGKDKDADSDERAVAFHDPGVTIEDEFRGQTWYLVAITEPATDRANITVNCAPKDKNADSAGYGWALVPDPSRAQIGQGIGSMATAAGVVWAVVTFWRWRKARR